MGKAIRYLRLARARRLRAAALLAIVLIAGSGWRAVPAAQPSVRTQDGGVAASEAMARLPLSFVENRGQMPDDVVFYAHDSHADLLFTPSAFVTRLRAAEPGAPPAELRVQMAGARADAAPISLERAPSVVNIFEGNDPSRWRTGIPTHARIGYSAPWPGIDVWYDGRDGRLESTYAVSAGADPALVRLRYSGHDALSLAADGGLLIRTRAGLFAESAPVIYQEIGAQRVRVDGRFDIVDHDTVGFVVAAYDRGYPLLIDPVMTYTMIKYSTYLGGAGSDQANAIAVDGTGNAYIAGFTTSTGQAGTSFGLRGARDAFVIKLNPTGSAVLYATYIGGTGDDEAKGIAFDGTNVYITGSTTSLDLPTAGPPFQAVAGGGIDAFVTKLNGVGAPTYSTYLGGSGDDTGRGITVSAGKVFVTGRTLSADYPLASAPLGNALLGLSDAFVTKLDPAAATPVLQLVYSQYLGGSLPEDGRAIAVDVSGNAYVTGSTGPTTPIITANDFPLVPIAMVPIGPVGFEDAFVTKIGPTGTRIYSTLLGGSGVDGGYGIALDATNNAYVTGLTHSTNFPVTGGALQAANGGGDDAFVTKLNPAGAAPIYSTYLGGSGGDAAASIAINAAGEAFITGSTFSGNFPTFRAFAPNHASASADAFAARIDPTGTALMYSTYLGGSLTDRGWGIAVDGASNAYVAGSTLSTNFPGTGGGLQPANAGLGDAFVISIALATSSVGGVSTAPDAAALPVRVAGHAGASANPMALAILAGVSLAAVSAATYARRRRG